MISKNEKTEFFVLLPHHDDEIFLISWLKYYQQDFPKVFFHLFFLTFDDFNPQVGEARRRSSHKLLSRILQPNSYQIWDIGKILKIRPKELSAQSHQVVKAIEDSLFKGDLINSQSIILAPLAQNSHTDHLETSLIALRVRGEQEILFFPTYSLEKFYRVSVLTQSSLKQYQTKFSISDLGIGIVLHKVEWKTWTVLGPLLILRTLINNGFVSLFDSREALEYLEKMKSNWIEDKFILNMGWRRRSLQVIEIIENELRKRGS